jgi:hypothetical protein
MAGQLMDTMTVETFFDGLSRVVRDAGGGKAFWQDRQELMPRILPSPLRHFREACMAYFPSAASEI